ncbi:MAG: DUF86 domain-containing protein [Patescibacteria group bacterium]
MKINRDKLHLFHIRDAIEKIEKYLNEINYDDFAKKNRDYDAILMQIVVIGEAVNNLSDEFKEKHQNLPWYQAVGLRNRIAHGYVDVDIEVIWKTIKEDIPILSKDISFLLESKTS